MFEWLMMALPSSRLEEEWVRRGAARIATDLINSVNDDTEMGGMYHACHSLVLYQQRMAQIRAREEQESPPPQELAQSPEPIPQSTAQSAEPLPLPNQSDVTELERPDEAIVQNPANEPTVTNNPGTPPGSVPLIVTDIEPEAPPAATVEEPEAIQPEAVPDVTPPLILMPELLTQENEPAPSDIPDEPVTSQPNEPTGQQIPLIVTDEQPSSNNGPGIPLVVVPEPEATSEEAAVPPAVTPDDNLPALPQDGEVANEPTTNRPGLSFITPNADQPETQTPAPGESDAATQDSNDAATTQHRVFNLTMPESTGNIKPRSATSEAPGMPGSHPVTGAAPSATPQ
jgi:hypothetical protein